MRKWTFSVLCLSLLAWPAGSEQRPAPRPVELQPLGWEPYNRAQLERMMHTYGRGHRGYDSQQPPCAVFDWDNTSVFLDVEEATIVYQLSELRFGATPAELEQALWAGVPRRPFTSEFRNAAGDILDVDRVAADVLSSYTWLYEHRSLPLEQRKQTPQYQDFTTKYRYLYDALDGSFGAPVSYPWITFFFTGLKPAEVRTLVRDAVRWQLEQPIGKVTWSSPPELPGRAGQVSVTWRNGLRLLPEMQNLQRTLREEGFEVWICTASLSDVIRGVACDPEFGYHCAADHVIGIELEQDGEGRFQPEPKDGFELTFGAGKTAALRRRLPRPPLFVAGDSSGDQDMLVDFPSTHLSLLINRWPSPGGPLARLRDKAVEQHGTPAARFLLQGRDENRGVFVPRMESIPLGSVTPLLR